MDDIEIPQHVTDVEIRLELILAAANLAALMEIDHDQVLSYAQLWHDWVDPAGVDRVRVERVD